MEYSIESDYILEEKKFNCKLKLEPGCMTAIYGANGLGKSSFLQFLKLNQKEIFSQKKLVFVDQRNLQPLNDISLDDVLVQLQGERIEELSSYQELATKMTGFLDKPIKELSGGQNQLAKLLIALYISGDIFVFDEPLQQLDEKNVSFIKEILYSLKKQKKSLLLIEHRKESIRELVDYPYTMKLSGKSLELIHGS